MRPRFSAQAALLGLRPNKRVAHMYSPKAPARLHCALSAAAIHVKNEPQLSRTEPTGADRGHAATSQRSREICGSMQVRKPPKKKTKRHCMLRCHPLPPRACSSCMQAPEHPPVACQPHAYRCRAGRSIRRISVSPRRAAPPTLPAAGCSGIRSNTRRVSNPNCWYNGSIAADVFSR